MDRNVAIGLLRGTPLAPGRVREVPVPPSARALSTLPRIDYEDACVVETPLARERTGEQWARVILEDASPAMRQALRAGWLALGVQLGSTRSEQLVLGWELRRSGPDYALLAARSRLGLSAEVLVKRGRQTLLMATFLQQENAVARALWAGISPGHRQVVRYVLEQGSRR